MSLEGWLDLILIVVMLIWWVIYIKFTIDNIKVSKSIKEQNYLLEIQNNELKHQNRELRYQNDLYEEVIAIENKNKE